MNNNLKNEIIKHIFSKLDNTINITNDAYLIDKRIVFASEDKDYQRKAWGVSGEVEKNNIMMLVADITDQYEELVLLFQMNKFPVYALRVSKDSGDFGSFYFLGGERWIGAGVEMQAKFLYGFENLINCFITWKSLKDYKDIYEQLISFLKFLEM